MTEQTGMSDDVSALLKSVTKAGEMADILPISTKLRREKAARQEAEREALEAEEAMRKVKVGTVMEDGSIYAGVSPDTGERMYAMPEDSSLLVSFREAAAYARELNRKSSLGHKDWRVPSKDELSVLFAAREEGGFNGTFNNTGQEKEGWYWSSTVHIANVNAWMQRFTTGKQAHPSQICKHMVRCVRIVPAIQAIQ